MKQIIFLMVLLYFAIKVHAQFTPNQGQVSDMHGNAHPEVQFTFENENSRMFFLKDKIIYSFHELYSEPNEKSDSALKLGDIIKAKELSMKLKVHRLDLEFVNSNINNTNILFDEASINKHYQNFYLAHCPRGIKNVESYNKVIYENIYPNIDLIFKYENKGLKYDIVLKPGANIEDIKLRYNGAKKLTILENTYIQIEHEFGNISEIIPFSFYQEDGSEEKVMFKKIDSLTFGFYALEKINDFKTLVIDPTLNWSTYFERTTLGGTVGIRGNTEVDPTGNLFYQVNTYYADLPLVNPGGTVYFDPSFNVTGFGLDIYFAKFNTNRELVWSTYLGGSGGQNSYYDHGIAFDNNIFYLTGTTNSNDFPLINQGGGAYYKTYSGTGSRGFLSKFNITTGQMIHSTYLNAYSYINMATDNNGNIAIVSSNYTFTVVPDVVNRIGAFNQSSFTGTETEMFIYMFDQNLNQIWGTYFGGTGYSDPMGIKFDKNNDLYIFARSDNANAIPLVDPGGGAYFSNTIADKYDYTISKFNSSGTLVWSTLYGGMGLEGLSFSNIEVNSNNDLILTSQTSSTDIPTYNPGGGAYFKSAPAGLINGWGGSGESSGFMLVFDENGVIKLATYVGMDNESNYIQDQATGTCEKHYLTLTTKTFPTTPLAGAYNANNADPTQINSLFIEFNNDFSVNWASYLHNDSIYIERLASDTTLGRLYYTGIVRARDLIIQNPGSSAYIDSTVNSSPSTWVYVLGDFNIGVGSSANIISSSPYAVCSGDTAILIGSGSGSSLNWYDAPVGGNLIGTGDTLVIPNITINTWVYLEAVGGVCSSSIRDSLLITIQPAPSNPVTVNDTICLGNWGQLQANSPGATVYYWYSQPTGGSLVNIGQTFTTNPDSTVTYYVEAQIGLSCKSGRTPVTMIVNPNPELDVQDTIICYNDSVLLFANSSNPVIFNWYANAVGGVPIHIGNPFLVSPTLTTNYYVQITDSFGCKSYRDTVTVYVNPELFISVLQNAPSCFGASDGYIELSVSGGTPIYTYEWSNSSINVTNNQDSLFAGVYVITIYDSLLCNKTINVSLTQPNVLEASINVINVSCFADSNGLAIINPTGGTTPYSILWDANANSQTTDTAYNLIAGTYLVTLTDVNGCDTVYSITVNQPAEILINKNNTDTICYSANNGVALITPYFGTSPYTYQWDSNANNQTDSVANNLSAGTYYFTVTDANGCLKIDSIQIYQYDEINFNIGASNNNCGKNEYAYVNVLNVTGLHTYLWNDPLSQTNDTAYNLTPGIYNVTVSDIFGCSKFASIEIKDTNSVETSIFADTTKGFNPLLVSFSQISTDNVTNYLYEFPSDSFSTIINPTYQFSEYGNYWVYLTVSNAYCSAIDSIYIMVDASSSIIVPNVFTPNNDGNNDKFIIQTTGMNELFVEIFDRWGLKIYEWNNFSFSGWDGRTKSGQIAPDGTYYYLMNATGFDGKSYNLSGHFTLLR